MIEIDLPPEMNFQIASRPGGFVFHCLSQGFGLCCSCSHVSGAENALSFPQANSVPQREAAIFLKLALAWRSGT